MPGFAPTSCIARTLSVSDSKATIHPARQLLPNVQTSVTLRLSKNALYVFSIAPPCSATPIALLSCHPTQAKRAREAITKTCACNLPGSLARQSIVLCQPPTLQIRLQSRRSLSSARSRQQNPVTRPFGVSFNASPNGSSSFCSNARISWPQSQ
jgi:hypothetical protein